MILAPIASANCISFDQSQTSINWKAYKTPAKAGVGGSFKEFTLSTSKEAKSIKDALKKATFTIDTTSVFTKNPARDKKIATFFFKTMAGGEMIKGKVLNVTDKKVTVALTMNGKTVEAPLAYTFENNKFVANGVIDVLDFAMNDELKAINKACYSLHEGKTWSDVNIEITSNFKTCK